MNLGLPRAAAALALIAVSVALYWPTLSYRHGWAMDDFKAFYCSGRVMLERANPYGGTELARCEAQPAPRPLFVAKPGFVLPAPLPGYAVAAFAVFGWMPFVPAATLWLLVLAAATTGAMVLLSRMTAVDAWTLLATFGIALVTISFSVGELVPVALFGVVLTAWSVRRGVKSGTDAFCAVCGIALAFCEPQIGIAVAIACVALTRRVAATAVATAVALVAISLAAIGVAGNVAYVREILPAHIAAELPAYFQFSLSWIAARVGTSPAAALLVGRLDWLAMLAAAALFARSRFAQGRPEIAVLAAPAFAVAGGPFLHLDHIALALPAAIWIARCAPRAAWLETAAIVALALPALHFFLNVGRAPLGAELALYGGIAAWLGAAYGGNVRTGTIACGVTIAVLVGIAVAFLSAGFGFANSAVVQGAAGSTPQDTWAHFVASHYVMTAWTVWLVKAPTWFGIAATAVGLGLRGLGYRTVTQRSGVARYAT